MGHPPKKSSSVSPHTDSTVDKLGVAMNGKGSADLSGDTFGFTISGTSVTAMSTLKGTSSYALKLPANASSVASTVNGVANVTETFVQGNAIETIKFVQPSGGTLFAIASDAKSFVPLGASTTRLDVHAEDRPDITLTGNSATAVQSVAANGVKTSLALSANLVFQELTAGDPSLIQALATRNGQTSCELFLKITTT